MTKTILAIFILVIFLGAAIWLLINKSNSVQNVLNSPSPTPTVTPASSVTSTPTASGQANEIPTDKVSGQELTVGTGVEAKTGDTVQVNYVGMFLDGKKFDSSYDRGQPFEFTLGAGQVISGWDIGVVGMKVGGKRRLIIPPQFGYGAKDNGPIPANSTLVFDIELLKVTVSSK